MSTNITGEPRNAKDVRLWAMELARQVGTDLGDQDVSKEEKDLGSHGPTMPGSRGGDMQSATPAPVAVTPSTLPAMVAADGVMIDSGAGKPLIAKDKCSRNDLSKATPTDGSPHHGGGRGTCRSRGRNGA